MPRTSLPPSSPAPPANRQVPGEAATRGLTRPARPARYRAIGAAIATAGTLDISGAQSFSDPAMGRLRHRCWAVLVADFVVPRPIAPCPRRRHGRCGTTFDSDGAPVPVETHAAARTLVAFCSRPKLGERDLVGLANGAWRWGDEIDEVAHPRPVGARAGNLVARVAPSVHGEQHGVAEPLLGDLGVAVKGCRGRTGR
jgi:hypothetical protein